jgi:hypothetical protein
MVEQSKIFILDKIARNLNKRGYEVTRGADCEVILPASGRVISYVDANVQKPLGGIDGDVSPFLGMGVVHPGSLKLKGAAGENTLAAIMVDAESMDAYHEMSGHGNDLVVEAGDTTAELSFVRGHADFISIGK